MRLLPLVYAASSLFPSSSALPAPNASHPALPPFGITFLDASTSVYRSSEDYTCAPYVLLFSHTASSSSSSLLSSTSVPTTAGQLPLVRVEAVRYAKAYGAPQTQEELASLEIVEVLADEFSAPTLLWSPSAALEDGDRVVIRVLDEERRMAGSLPRAVRVGAGSAGRSGVCVDARPPSPSESFGWALLCALAVLLYGAMVVMLLGGFGYVVWAVCLHDCDGRARYWGEDRGEPLFGTSAPLSPNSSFTSPPPFAVAFDELSTYIYAGSKDYICPPNLFRIAPFLPSSLPLDGSAAPFLPPPLRVELVQYKGKYGAPTTQEALQSLEVLDVLAEKFSGTTFLWTPPPALEEGVKVVIRVTDEEGRVAATLPRELPHKRLNGW
ncbi:hypothetical protein JCM8097_003189 [Rhodosporidiobolus ruineniae]